MPYDERRSTLARRTDTHRDGVGEILPHAADARAVGGLEDGGDKRVQLVLVHGLVVRAVGGAEHGVRHPGPNLGVDGVGGALLGADHRLVEHVLAVGGVHGVRSSLDGRRDGHGGGGALRLEFLGLLERVLEDARDGGGVGSPDARDGAWVGGVGAASEQIRHPLARRGIVRPPEDSVEPQDELGGGIVGELVVARGEVELGDFGRDVCLGGRARGVGGFGHGLGLLFVVLHGVGAETVRLLAVAPFCWAISVSPIVKEDKITREMVSSYDIEVLR
jgi:hypothetical protein